jgi:hypothetical protein
MEMLWCRDCRHVAVLGLPGRPPGWWPVGRPIRLRAVRTKYTADKVPEGMCAPCCKRAG